MARIEREWLRRFPDFVWREQRVRKRRPPEPGEDGEPAPEMREAEEGDDPQALEAEETDERPEGDEAAAAGGEEDPDAEPGEDDGERAEGEPGTSAEAGQSSRAPEGEPADGGDAEGEPDLDTSLHVPEAIEREREEERAKRARGLRNRGLAPKAFDLEGHYLRNLAARFARMVSKVAEDSADMPAQGDEEWDLVELTQRRFTGRLVNQCRMTREKRKVAVVLDTSPSCEHQARLFAAVARVAEELGDCELYDAPNFAIVRRKLGEAWEPLEETQHEWDFRRRVVLAFGDFDGIDRICEASAQRGNKIYWFCCEERPSVLERERETFVSRYKGRYFPATTIDQLMRAMARVR